MVKNFKAAAAEHYTSTTAQDTFQWLRWYTSRGNWRSMGKCNHLNANHKTPFQGTSWAARLPEPGWHTSTPMPGSPSHRHLCEGSPPWDLPTPRHSDLRLLPLISQSCLIYFFGLAASTRNREKSIGYFPQYHSLPFSFCSLLLPELARIVVCNPLPIACNPSLPAHWCKKCSHTLPPVLFLPSD